MPHEINTRWFQDRLRDRQLSQREAAKLIGIDASGLSLMLHGKRGMEIDEAAALARVLHVPVTDVMLQAGIPVAKDDVRRAQTGNHTPVVGWIDEHGEIHTHHKGQAPEKVLTQPGVPDGTVAVCYRTVMTSFETMDGGLVYFRPADRVLPSAIGRLCVVRLVGNGTTLLRYLRRSYDDDIYGMLNCFTRGAETARIATATPVLWIRP